MPQLVRAIRWFLGRIRSGVDGQAGFPQCFDEIPAQKLTAVIP